MFKVIAMVAEQKIQEDMRNGGFDNLKGAGKPLKLEDDSLIPPDLRMAYRILKNGGFVPQEIQEEKDVQTMLDLIGHLEDEQERYRQIRKLNYMVMKINQRRNRPINLEKSEYYQEIVQSLPVASGKLPERT